MRLNAVLDQLFGPAGTGCHRGQLLRTFDVKRQIWLLWRVQDDGQILLEEERPEPL